MRKGEIKLVAEIAIAVAILILLFLLIKNVILPLGTGPVSVPTP